MITSATLLQLQAQIRTYVLFTHFACTGNMWALHPPITKTDYKFKSSKYLQVKFVIFLLNTVNIRKYLIYGTNVRIHMYVH